ncbi:hypothetical protein ACFYTQ_22885 [Nocardia sp. NPDC004068]|uniref:hypothetical protein n=1 Tax=Nocardia sp. NPDC004068 TaxID=3364303 RepID=UPI003686682B
MGMVSVAEWAVRRFGRGRVRALVYAVGWTVAVVASVIGLWIIVALLPPGDDPAAVARFFHDYNGWLRGAAFVVACAVVYVVWFSAELTSRMLAADSSSRGRLGRLLWTSEIVFYAVFAVEAGVFAALPLSSPHVGAEALTALHVAVLVAAAPLGLLGVPYLLALYLIARRDAVFPRWLRGTVLVCLVLNLSLATGFFTLRGPFSAVDGVVCMGGNLIAFFVLPAVLTSWLVDRWLDETVSSA